MKYRVILENIFMPIDIRALNYAKKVHETETRHDGSPYINHPYRVASLVEYYMQDKCTKSLKAAAYLHDTIENTNTTYHDLLNIFGSEIAYLVLELTTDEDLKNEIGKTRYLELKMKNMSDMALVIKLCDRLDNLRDVKHSTKEFIAKQTESTIDILSFLIMNRGLTDVHYNIIQDILEELYLQEENDQLKSVTIANLIACLSGLKNSKQEYYESLKRMKKE